MGIKLDWEVESEAGWSEIGEDPAALDARRRRGRQLRNAAIVLFVIAGIIAGGIGWRLRQVGRQLRADLETTVSVESTALRLGDKGGFLGSQSDQGEWQRLQSLTFDQYQALGDRLTVSGEIISTEITADQARVMLEEELDGKPYHVQWFYEHNQNGWLHIPPSPDFWGEQARTTTTYFDFFYYQQDQALVDALTLRLNGWWETACRATACSEYPSLIRVRVEPDPLVDIGWAPYDRATLLIPSPLLGRVPADGSIDPQVIIALSTLLSERWAEQSVQAQLTEPPRIYSDAAWVQNELALWMQSQFVDGSSRSAFFGSLTAAYGFELVANLLPQLPLIQNDQSIVTAIETVTDDSVTNISIDWSSYFAQRLRAETRLTADGFATEAILLYHDPEREQSPIVIDVPTETLAEPASIRVLSMQTIRDTQWAEVEFSLVDGNLGDKRITYEPFRLVGNRWVHSWAQLEDWGSEQQEASAHFVLQYYDLDQNSAVGLLPYLEQIYAQTSADFGLDTALLPIVEVTILPSTDRAGFAGTPVLPLTMPNKPIAPASLIVPSPYASVRSADSTAREFILRVLTRDLVTGLMAARIDPFPPNHPLAAAFLIHEVEQYEMDGDLALQGFLIDHGRLSDPQPITEDGPLAFTTPYTDEGYHAARVLLDVLIDRYGLGAVPALMQTLPQATSMDDWLNQSLGITFDDVRNNWDIAMRASGE
jgi:hypothetical protein